MRKRMVGGVLVSILLALAITGLSLLAGACASTRPYIRFTNVLSVNVTPSSGPGPFQMTVDYRWSKSGKARPAEIDCFYVRPDGSDVYIHTIDPANDPLAAVLVEDEMLVESRTTLTFDVIQKDGTVQPGKYGAACTILVGEAPRPSSFFTVTAEPEPAEPEPTTSEPKPTTTEDTTTTSAPAPVFNLLANMQLPSEAGYTLYAAWEGPLTVGPDGSVREKVSGTFKAVVPLEVNRNGQRFAHYNIYVDFTVDVAGSMEMTKDGLGGVVAKLQQTFADIKVRPCTVADGSILQNELNQCTEATEVAAPKWLDQILTELTFEGTSLPATQDVSVGKWQGTATISRAQ